jgi:hypothetical protein
MHIFVAREAERDKRADEREENADRRHKELIKLLVEMRTFQQMAITSARQLERAERDAFETRVFQHTQEQHSAVHTCYSVKE